MPRRSDAHSGWSFAAACALVWFPAAALGLYLKHGFMQKEYLVIARSLGRDVASDLTAWEALSFYRTDVLLLLLVIPVVLIVGLRVIADRYRAAAVSSVSVLFAVFFFVNLQTLGNVGRYMSAGLLFDTVRWGLGHPTFVDAYLPPATLVKLGVVVLVIAGLSFLSASRSPRWPGLGRLRALMPIGLAAVLCLAVVAGGLGWLSPIPTLPQHRSVLEETVRSFLDLGHVGASEFEAHGSRELAALYRTFTRAPSADPDPRFWGKEAGSDVILFIFETGPTRSLDLEGDLGAFPNIRALLPRSFAAVSHHTTYPYTSYALFSILGSLYPPSSMRLQMKNHPEAIQTGLMKRLADRGYATRAYTPYVARFEEDEKMFEHLGIQHHFIAEQASAPSSALLARVEREVDALGPLPPSEADRTHAKLRHELAALEALKTDVAAFKKSGKRFAAAILPQLGHAPWPDLRGHGDDYPARGRALMAIQDGWLGEILAVLQAAGSLDDTVVVVTSDHGIRTRKEDPSFRAGTTNDYSFRVPLVVHAPKALRAPAKISWVTSHVDIGPTVLDLLGVKRRPESEQGAPIWDPRLARRTTFFLAGGYLGADAYHSQGEYYMLNRLSNAVHRSKRLDFGSETLVAPGSVDHAAVIQTLDTLDRFQRRWLTLPPPSD